MLSLFFLKRPVFAWVIALLIMLVGGLAIHILPISQYPPVAPPSIYIRANYRGASAETTENSVTQIIEQKMTGLDDMIYITAESDSAGAARLELTFAPGTDPDLAWSKVQNKLQLAMASLPESVQQQGVTVGKSTRNYLMVIDLISEDGRLDGKDLRDYAQSNLEKVLARVPGVGEVEIFGSQYAMRVWLNPVRLTDYALTIEDVIAALKAYNVEISAGQFGSIPAVKGQRLNTSIIVQNLLKTPEEFGNIPLRINPDGSVVRIQDVGRVELGTESYEIEGYYNSQPSAGIAIRQAAGANALDTANAVKAKMVEMSRYFPDGVKTVYPYETTPFIEVSIHEVVKTLFEAVLLVFIIMWLFLGSFRATLIPTIAVPVVLLGTFAVILAFGFSINMLTMFAMVLAIGLLVDDAIVVVENVERVMEEEGLPPYEATAKSMKEITSALIGIGLVLSAVFGPMAFFGGSTGVIYRQFSVTIISSMLLSVLVALILTPVLCATFLKPVNSKDGKGAGRRSLLQPFFDWFNRVFSGLRTRYVNAVRFSFSHKFLYFLVYVVIIGLVGLLFMRLPTAYLPDEDQGVMLIQLMLPAGSTLEQTKEVAHRVEEHFRTNEKDTVESVMSIIGIGFSGRAQSNGIMFVKLKKWEQRTKAEHRVKAIAGRAMRAFMQYRDALVFAFQPPPITELGNATGFDAELLDRAGQGHHKLMEARNALLMAARQDPRLRSVRHNGMDDVTECHIDVDWERAGALGIPINSIHNVISASFGGAYVNDFIQAGRVKKVMVQMDTPYRMLPSDLEKLRVRNSKGKMVPFSSFASFRWGTGAPRLERFNGFPAVNIQGEPAPGYSSGDAMAAIEEIVETKLPKGFGLEWNGSSYQERMSSSQTYLLYGFSIIVIFLCVAALYESWAIPVANLLMLPLGVFGAALATYLRGMHNDVYFQIGFLTTLGLTTKNAILIIQFARERMANGEGLIAATLGAAGVRLRPVIMTSLAFFFGVLPLALAKSAGAGAMSAIGTAVAGGMLSATFIDLFYIPLLFVVISKLFKVEEHNRQLAMKAKFGD